MIELRNERAGDAAAIEALTLAAFREAPHRGGNEHLIVRALRETGALTLSRVACAGAQLLGHVALSPVQLSSGDPHWYGLGPVSVLPDHQRRGIGSALIRDALARLERRGARGCVVLGEPAYYGRFGFRPCALELPGVPAAYFQGLPFSGDCPAATVRYAAAFDAG